MEPLTIFASSIGFIGTFHLVSTAVNRWGKGIYSSGSQQNKREDWYCFFKLSDLVGADTGADDNRQKHNATVSETERLQQRRRQEAQRPRLRT
jgi:hypothetical protein